MQIYCKTCDKKIETVRKIVNGRCVEECPNCGIVYESMDIPSREPIIEFKDESQAYECLKEWQTRLFLDDWVIRLALLEPHEMPDVDCDGYNHYFNTTKSCKISIARKSKDDANCLVKHCEEYILVHELLHCKPWLTHYAENGGSLAGCFIEQHEHAMLEQMAKSLIMAKYGLDFSWFKNF